MRYLVLLLLVAICQGGIHRENKFDQLHDVDKLKKDPVESNPLPELKESLEDSGKLQQQYKRRPLESIQVDKQFKKPSLFGNDIEIVQRPQNLLPYERNAQFDTNYPGQKTSTDYIKFQEHPWNRLAVLNKDVFGYKNLKDLLQFPGGDFLQREIEKCMWNMQDTDLPVYTRRQYPKTTPLDTDIDLENVKGVRDVLPFIAQKLERMVPLYMETIEDPTTAALMVTRDLIKIVLKGRMKCSSTFLDKNLVENVKERLSAAINENTFQLIDNFRTVLQEALPLQPEVVEPLVSMFIVNIQEDLYQGIVQYTEGAAFKDVAVTCHKLYRELKRLFEESWQQDVPDFMQQLVTIVTDVITNYGSCPTQESYQKKMEFACWDFNKLFSEREVAQVHSKVMNIVHHFLSATCTGEECALYYPRISSVLKNVVNRYIFNVIQEVPMCRRSECLDPWECLLYKRNFLEFQPLVQTM